MYFQPVLALLGFQTLVFILLCEASSLSDTMFLGIQVVILVAAGAGGLGVVLVAFEQSSRLVVGTALGACLMMVYVSMFGFVRALVVWWLGDA